jgi:hypothetical protein
MADSLVTPLVGSRLDTNSLVCRKPSTRNVCMASCSYSMLRTTVLLVWSGGASDSGSLFYEFDFLVVRPLFQLPAERIHRGRTSKRFSSR